MVCFVNINGRRWWTMAVISKESLVITFDYFVSYAVWLLTNIFIFNDFVICKIYKTTKKILLKIQELPKYLGNPINYIIIKSMPQLNMNNLFYCLNKITFYHNRQKIVICYKLLNLLYKKRTDLRIPGMGVTPSQVESWDGRTLKVI